MSGLCPYLVPPSENRTLVVGLGNPILTDDGVGIRVAQEVRAALPSSSRIDVCEACIGGLRLMEALLGYDRVILIDAMAPYQGRPGTVHRLTLEELDSIGPTRHSFSPHDMGLVAALEIGRNAGLPLPSSVVIYGIEIENATDFGDTPTPVVAAAVPLVVDAVLDELGLLVYD